MPPKNNSSKSKKNARPADPRTSEELLSQVLVMDLEENEKAWDLIRILQSRLTTIFPKVQEMVRSDSVPAKCVAAAILGQNGREDKSLGAECVAELVHLLQKESDPAIIGSAVAAIGSFEGLAPRDLILSFAEHPDADVRFHVACAIGTFEDDKSIAAQIKLSQDSDRDTRNWATFGLGSLIDEDTPAIRAALAARLDEEDAEIRGEAMVGLANLLDPRVIGPLLKELKDASPDRPGSHWEEAVEVIGDHADKLGPEWDRLLAVLEDLDFSEKN